MGTFAKLNVLKIVSDDLAGNNYGIKTDCKYRENQIKLGHEVKEVTHKNNCFIFNILFFSSPETSYCRIIRI